MRAFVRSIRRLRAPALALALCTAARADSKTFLLNFGANGANGYTASDTANGDINYLDGTQNGSGFSVDQVVPIVGGNNADGQTFPFGGYTLTMTSAYAAYNIRNSPADNSAVYGTFFLTHGQTPVSFTLSGLHPTDIVSISFLSSQAWAIRMTASATGDFSGNAVTASSKGVVIHTTRFTQLGASLTGSPVVYVQFVAANGSGREGDLSAMIINITSGPASTADAPKSMPSVTPPLQTEAAHPATPVRESPAPAANASAIPEPSAYAAPQ